MTSLFILDNEEVTAKVQNREVRICIFGLGKMGLPIACAFADTGFEVVGVDIDPKVVKNVNSGKTWFHEPQLDKKLREAVKKGKLNATTDGAEAVQRSDFIICIVPLTLDEKKKPDLHSISQVAELISNNLQKGKVVSFETTLPLGTTENFLKPILEKSGLKAGKDFGLVYAPERLMSGHVFSRLTELKKIIGGVNQKSSFIAAEIYKTIHPSGVVIVRNPRTAEMIKLTAGVWRDVNIAFANEMAKIADEYHVDIMEVIDQVNASPRRMMLQPGCGVGGHCIPVYPYFLIDTVQSDIPVVEAARKTNESMPGYTVKLAEEQLRKKGKKIEDSTVVILGLSFRPNIKETANSPTLDLVRILKQKGSKVSVFDPLFDKQEIEDITGTKSGQLNHLLKDADCIIISTMHNMFQNTRKKTVGSCAIIDGRNELKDADKSIGR